MKRSRFKAWQAALFMACLLVSSIVLSGATAVDSRANAGSNYALELDGVVVGWLNSSTGGNAVGEVISETAGPSIEHKKHIGAVKYEDIKITAGSSMSKAFYQWMKSALIGSEFVRKNGAIIETDSNFRELSRLTFFNGVIDELTFPALDTASKSAAYFTVSIKPETARRTVAAGNKVNSPSAKGKQWLASNFNFTIDGLNVASSAVNKIDALTVKFGQIDALGENRDPVILPSKTTLPNVSVTLPEARSQPLYDWLEDFLIRGNNGDSKEKDGTLTYLTPDLKTALFTLNFSHLGIVTVSPDTESNSSNRRTKAEMYTERISFTDNSTTTN